MKLQASVSVSQSIEGGTQSPQGGTRLPSQTLHASVFISSNELHFSSGNTKTGPHSLVSASSVKCEPHSFSLFHAHSHILNFFCVLPSRQENKRESGSSNKKSTSTSFSCPCPSLLVLPSLIKNRIKWAQARTRRKSLF